MTKKNINACVTIFNFDTLQQYDFTNFAFDAVIVVSKWEALLHYEGAGNYLCQPSWLQIKDPVLCMLFQVLNFPWVLAHLMTMIDFGSVSFCLLFYYVSRTHNANLFVGPLNVIEWDRVINGLKRGYMYIIIWKTVS